MASHHHSRKTYITLDGASTANLNLLKRAATWSAPHNGVHECPRVLLERHFHHFDGDGCPKVGLPYCDRASYHVEAHVGLGFYVVGGTAPNIVSLLQLSHLVPHDGCHFDERVGVLPKL